VQFSLETTFKVIASDWIANNSHDVIGKHIFIVAHSRRDERIELMDCCDGNKRERIFYCIEREFEC